MCVEVRSQALQQPIRLQTSRRDICDQMILMHLRPPRQERGHERDTDAASNIAHEIKDADRVPHLLRRDALHGQRHQRNEEKTQGHSLQHLRPADVPEPRIQIET